MTQTHIDMRPGIPGLLPQALIIKPADTADAPPVVAVHGIRREVETMADLLMPVVLETGRTVILPVFDRTSWRLFQRAACKQRSDLALLQLMASLRQDGTVRKGRLDLSGYSGGGQFAHRFTWLYPRLVNRLCATAPGWWTFPDVKTAYPYGIADTNRTKRRTAEFLRANLRKFLDRDIIVRVGALDTDRDENLRQSAALDAQQGANRVERARNWSETVRDACLKAGLPDRVDFAVLPNCTHSFADCVAQAKLDRDFVVAATSETSVPAYRASANWSVA